MSDPYADPRREFEELRNRKGIKVSKINEKTDFQQAKEIGKMDIEISNFEMKLKDRPKSKEYLLIASPKVCVNRSKGSISGRFKNKPNVAINTESINTNMADVNFYFGREEGDENMTAIDEKLSLLKQTFSIDVEYKKLSYSEVIEKIDTRECDKAGEINIQIDPMLLILPQSIYTYMLRCADLNTAYTDDLREEYHFIKWLGIDEYYQNLNDVVDKRFNMTMPALSLTLQNSDGSYLAEMLFKEFTFKMISYMDTAKKFTVCGK